MILVTGGAGFIGSHLIKGLNNCGLTDIVVIDDLKDGYKFRNLLDCKISDYLDKDDFIKKIVSHSPKDLFGREITTIFHQGACSNTQEWDGRLMMAMNYSYSQTLLHFCMHNRIQFIYASSAAVYGRSHTFKEEPEYEKPLNLYGYSKLLFDQYVRRFLAKAHQQIVGLRYFNVYGPHEDHKKSMASVIFHHDQQIKTHGKVTLFKGCHGYGDGEQKRDFIYINDIVKVNLWFFNHKHQSGIFNVGTSWAKTFNYLAEAVIDYHGYGEIEYIPFPPQLLDYYQSFTQADITKLRNIGYQETFTSLDQGIKNYLKTLN